MVGVEKVVGCIRVQYCFGFHSARARTGQADHDEMYNDMMQRPSPLPEVDEEDVLAMDFYRSEMFRVQ